MSSQGALAENVARRIVSAASDHVNENRRIFVRGGGQCRQEMDQRHRRHQGRVQLVQREDLAAEEVVLRAVAPGPDPTGISQVESQPGQERAEERDARERQSPSGRRGSAPAVGSPRAEPSSVTSDRRLEPGK